MVFRSRDLRKNLLWYKAKYETNYLYRKWIKELINKWWGIKGIVCDWRRWLLGGFGAIPTQMCTLHQKLIIKRYLTKRPRLEPNKELKVICMDIWMWTKKTMLLWLEDWYSRHQKWLMEKNYCWWFIHNRTLKAYRSLKRNMSYLYTYKEHPELWIPDTNNSLEWINSHLKSKVWIHRWLKEKRKCKVIEYYLFTS